MGKPSIKLFGIAILAVIFSTNIAFAQPALQAELNSRVNERKTRLKTKLDERQADRLKQRCAPAQQKLTAVLERFNNSNQPYSAKYESYLARLAKLQTKLKENNIDTTTLDQQIAEYSNKYQALKDATEKFKQSVNDAKQVDCVSDPDGFKAALDDARAEAQAVRQVRADLQTYAKETIKPSLHSLKESLNSASTQ
jgi:chromosome segregation ATPase